MTSSTVTARAPRLRLAGYWLLVVVPLTYGVIQTLNKAAQLFTG